MKQQEVLIEGRRGESFTANMATASYSMVDINHGSVTLTRSGRQTG